MIVEHTLEVVTRCPVNQAWDHYWVTVRVTRLLKTEELEAAAKEYLGKEIYQEVLTQEWSDRFDAAVTTQARHGRVVTTVRCTKQEAP